jgi:Leucine-rich repeat (LRR) protein
MTKKLQHLVFALCLVFLTTGSFSQKFTKEAVDQRLEDATELHKKLLHKRMQQKNHLPLSLEEKQQIYKEVHLAEERILNNMKKNRDKNYSNKNYRGVSTQDSLALVALYNSTNGEDWNNNTNWLDGPVKDWEGVWVESGKVVELDLYDNNLTGNLPAEIGNLSNLIQLNLNKNLLEDTIPAEIAEMTELKVLRLGFNNLEGNIPETIGNLTSLTELSLYYNNLEGSIPEDLANLRLLTKLKLTQNYLSGTIPTSIGNLQYLKRLGLSNNNLTGNLPETISNNSKLEYLTLYDNNLSGTLPEELGNLKYVDFLDLSYNKFTGTISKSLSGMRALEHLYLSVNEFNNLENLSKGELNNLSSFSVYLNNLLHTDLIPNKNLATGTFSYNPQAEIPVKENLDTVLIRATGETHIDAEEHVTSDLQHESNTYCWVRNFTELNSYSSDPGYTFTDFSEENEGKYTFKVKNALLPELTLESEEIYLELNHAPSNIGISDNIIDENEPAETLIGIISAEDENTNDTVELKLPAEMEDNKQFILTGNKLLLKNSLDYESANNYTAHVVAEDKLGATFSKKITIKLNNLNDNVPSFNEINISVEENPEEGSSMASLSARDADGDNLTYTLLQADKKNIIGVNEKSGSIIAKDLSFFDYEVNQSFEFKAMVSDGEYGDTARFTITINNTNDIAPVINDTTFTLDQNKTEKYIIGDIEATDQDGDINTLNFKIDSGNVNNTFSINETTGQLSLENLSIFDDTIQTIHLKVTVSDGKHQSNANVVIKTGNKATAIEGNHDNPSIMIYPNPTKGKLSVQIPGMHSRGTITLLDINGKKLETKKIQSDRTRLNLDKFQSGVYLLKINIDGKSLSKVIVKK